MTSEAPPPSARELEDVVELLCLVEAGRRIDTGSVPRDTLHWFLDHAARFVPVAWSAIGLMARLARDGDDELRAKVATALAELAQVLPARVESLLMVLGESAAPAVRAAVEGTLVVLLRGSEERGETPEELIERWVDRSPATRELIASAARVAALPAG